MVPQALVKAQVVDIAKPHATYPRQVAVDANVLYFIYYPNFSQLAVAGGRMPLPYQQSIYAAWVNKALRAETKFFTSTITFGEFIRLTEYAEMESLWLTDPAMPPGSQFSPQECKQARFNYSARLATIRQRAHAFLAAARKTVDLLPKFRSEIIELDQVTAEWQSSAGDFADAVLVANAKLVGMRDVLTDDGDFVTFDGITVYTANRTAIQAATVAGKLVN